MKDVVNLDRYPLDQPGSEGWLAEVAKARAALARDGVYDADGFVLPEALAAALAEVKPVFATDAFTHTREHNVYFKRSVDSLAPDHPALAPLRTTNHTVCADQIPESILVRLYEWPPLVTFLAAVMERETMFTMPDPLARVNVMAYREGEALNWHFDRSVFTTTLLVQKPLGGGRFQYVTDLRSDADPNYDGVADVISGTRAPSETDAAPGTLTVFKGKNTAHRVTPVEGDRERIIAVFSYYETPGVMFTDEERLGFFGRVS